MRTLDISVPTRDARVLDADEDRARRRARRRDVLDRDAAAADQHLLHATYSFHQSARLSRYQTSGPRCSSTRRAHLVAVEEVGLRAELVELAARRVAEPVEEPLVDRHAEALLRPVDQLVRDHAAHGALEDVLQLAVLASSRSRDARARARRTCGRGTARAPRG